MKPEAMEALVGRGERASLHDLDYLRDLLAALNEALDGRVKPLDVSALVSTEAALAIADAALPGWKIVLERASGWRCTLRESGTRDDDELIGVATGPTPALSLLGALLAVEARRARGYR
jgi:hypothetical protein